jgi:hypothetical protein
MDDGDEDLRRLAAARALVGLLEDGTRYYSVPSAAIPERVFGGGRDAIALAVLVSGYDAIESATRSWVQNHLTGKTSKEIEAAVAPGTILGDVLNSPITAEGGTLEAEVRAFLDRLRASERSAELAVKLEKRAEASWARADKLAKFARQAEAKASAPEARSREAERRIEELKILEPRRVGLAYKQMLDEQQAAGDISTDQYREGLALVKSAEDSFKLVDMRNRWLLAAAAVVVSAAISLWLISLTFRQSS